MTRHPGGEEHSRRLIELAGFKSGQCVLDMGAGAGESVKLMRSMGLDAAGVDLAPGDSLVAQGNFLQLEFPDASFDGVFSQCAFYVSGDIEKAFDEARRILKHSGILALSDVFFAPLESISRRPGFELLYAEDMTAQWREYYIEALWKGTADRIESRKNCRYYSLVFRKD